MLPRVVSHVSMQSQSIVQILEDSRKFQRSAKASPSLRDQKTLISWGSPPASIVYLRSSCDIIVLIFFIIALIIVLVSKSFSQNRNLAVSTALVLEFHSVRVCRQQMLSNVLLISILISAMLSRMYQSNKNANYISSSSRLLLGSS